MVVTVEWGIGKFTIFSLLVLFSTTTVQALLECRQIEITVDVQPEAILLTWATNPCAMVYIIRHYINGKLNHSATFPHPFSTLWLQREDCSAHSIQISTVIFPWLGPFDDVYENFSILWDGDTAVQNLEFNPGTRHFEWQAPESPENCDLKYLVEFTSDHGDYDETVLVNDEFFASPIADNIPCSTSHINVTSRVGRAEAYGESRSIVRTEPMADNLAVRNIRFESAEKTRFVWDAPDDTYFCNVEYEVHFTNDFDPIGGPVSTRDNFLDIAITPCSDNRITVIAVAYNGGHYRSEPISYHHRGPIPENLKVRNIRFESTDIGRFAWDPPEDSELCNITYIIHFTNEYYPVEGPREIDDSFHEIIVHPCSHNRISVITSAYNDGPYHSDPVDYSHRGPVPENLDVRNLRFDIENIRFAWEAPENSQLCNIRYKIHFTNELSPKGDTMETEDQFFNIELYPCSNNRISVITSVYNDGDYESEAVPYQHVGPVTRQLPEHISTDPFETIADVVWNIVPDDPNWCTVRDFVFEVNEKHNDDAPVTEFRILEYYDQIGEFRYTLTDLQNNTIYIYRTCFEFAEVVGVWYCGKSIEFPTTILRVPEIQLTTVTTSKIGFFWGNNENQDFVTGHTVFIGAIKPYHFTPAHCKSKWNMSSFVEQDLPATTESFNFEYAYPSFLYHIEVTTHFDGLGVNRTAMKDDVVTDEGVPGYLDIETSYDYVPFTPFNVSLKATWEIPCDINGAVQNFTYTLKGVLKSESIFACDVKIGSGVLDVASDLETYTDDEIGVDEPIFEIEIPGVLPFFDYVLEVETRIPKYSSSTTMELDDVPQAYAPPS